MHLEYFIQKYFETHYYVSKKRILKLKLKTIQLSSTYLFFKNGIYN